MAKNEYIQFKDVKHVKYYASETNITAVTVRGIVWIAKKVTERINFDASQIIDFVGWSIAGVSIVKIISNAMASVGQVKDFFMGVSNCIYKIAEIVDKITFWN